MMISNNLTRIVQEIIEEYYPNLHFGYRFGMEMYKNTFVISSDSRTLLLKFHNPLIRENKHLLENMYQTCSEKGLIPQIVPSREGAFLVEHKGVIASVQVKLDDEKTLIDPSTLGQRLSQLHSALRCIPCERVRNHLQRTVADIFQASIRYGYEYLHRYVEPVVMTAESPSAQLIHGDLHTHNLIQYNRMIYFIDLDSTTTFHPISDVAFAAYRLYGFDREKIQLLLNSYFEGTSFPRFKYEEIWPFVLYNILQRILFIRIEEDRGNTNWSYDLPSQNRYLRDVLHHCGV
ncbi:MAG: hypothetical protein C4527_23395 [Candidatus Omnitrophota bacterium]|jgi:Ser/Thr protein kinase RdoA (MazF antagonist)|nr:MAG: hypothetical protein C4527_23395 [Candidatus Omnitrophota bacterium]